MELMFFSRDLGGGSVQGLPDIIHGFSRVKFYGKDLLDIQVAVQRT